MQTVYLIRDTGDGSAFEMVFATRQAAQSYIDRFGNPDWKPIECPVLDDSTDFADLR